MSKNILAENMLRFGVKNLKESDKQSLHHLTEQGGEGKAVVIPYKQIYSLKPGDAKPDSYINQMHAGILQAINSNPAAKAMFDSKSIKLVGAVFNGGASNTWGGKPTGFDRELNNTAQALTPTETVLYQKNLDLAKQRADACKTKLLELLAQDGIKIATINPPTINARVFNTGGKLNANAQIIEVKLFFDYLAVSDITAMDDIKPKFISTGQYRTIDGKSPTGQVYTDTAVWQQSVAKLTPEQKKDTKRILAFEVKWNVNILKNPYKAPWYRWVFYYGADGKIERISGRVYDKTLNASLSNIFKDNNNIPKNDPSLLKILSISGYDKAVLPYM
jgi:hypothetical protein